MFCSYCGKKVDGQSFCPYCGFDLINEVFPEAPVSAAGETPQTEPDYAQPDRAVPTGAVYAPPSERRAAQSSQPPVPYPVQPPQPEPVTYGDSYQQIPSPAPYTTQEPPFPPAYDHGGKAKKTRAERNKPEKVKGKKKTGLIVAVSVGAVILLAGATVLTLFLTADLRDYSKAKGLMEDGKYSEAIELFTKLGDYEDSHDLIPECQYLDAQQLLNNKKYDEAIDAFITLGDYKDSKDQILKCKYEKAVDLYNSGSYDEASAILSGLRADYPEADAFITQCDYARAVELYGSGDYEEAKDIFERLGDYEDSADKLKDCDYNLAQSLIESDPSEAIGILEALGDYKESKDVLLKAKMSYCQLNNKNTDEDTYRYLKELKAAKYAGADALYEELYTYRITDAFWNDDEKNSDPSSGVTKLSTKKDQILHFTLLGGTPDDTDMQIKYTVTWPNGGKANDSFKNRAVYYTLSLGNSSAGTLKVDLYTPDNKLLYTATVTVTA